MTTAADGTALIPVIPNSAPFINIVQDSTFLPFVIIPSDTQHPYAPSYIGAPNGPFSTQGGNFTTYAIDACMIDFV